MRRRNVFTPPAVLFALALSAGIASAQTSPPPSTGGLTATHNPEDGASGARTSVLQSTPAGDLASARRWLVEFSQPAARPALRASLKNRRTTLNRNPVRVP